MGTTLPPALPDDPTRGSIRAFLKIRCKIGGSNTLGTLCLVDFTPREFGHDQLEIMYDLAHMVTNEAAIATVRG